MPATIPGVYNPAAAVNTVSRNGGGSPKNTSDSVEKTELSQQNTRTDENQSRDNRSEAKDSGEREARISQVSIARASVGDTRLSAETQEAIRQGKVLPVAIKKPTAEPSVEISENAKALSTTGTIPEVTDNGAPAPSFAPLGATVDVSV